MKHVEPNAQGAAGERTTGAKFAPLLSELTASELEEGLLARWKSEKLVERALAAGDPNKTFVFYDGPPTANGRPGIHHVLARTVKDLFCRHRAMKGYHVPRKAGWDTHGLPVEIEVEKSLGISGKQEIETVGIEAFNRRCRESVWKYREEWEKLVERVAHWLDYADPYATYTNNYIESEWWALATMYNNGLLYKGHKILPYCSRCGTSLSSHEVAQGYDEVEDPSVYCALDLTGGSGGEQAGGRAASRRRIVLWTTTPWTLVSNAALAVNPDLTYFEVRKKNRSDSTLIFAESRADAVIGAGWRERWDVIASFAGRELAGMRYARPLDWVAYPEGTNHEMIIAEEFVTADDGSGVVHMSPAFGADDYAAGRKHNIAFLQPVNAKGEFPSEMPVVGGMFFKDADPAIIAELERRDVLWKAGKVKHTYPFCWRCDTPLLYYARSSWFIKTTAYKDEMIARNRAMHWVPPETGSGRFGGWLESNIDWAISRDRYWGTPLPVWQCDKVETHRIAVGSYAELAALAGRDLPADFDPHKPFIDAWDWGCKACAASGTPPAACGTQRRVPEVIDAWFDSGAMPFAQWHYPFENVERVAAEFPADYIAEGVDQTRGWFYSLLAIATGLGDQLPNNGAGQASPYRAVVVHDLVRDANGQKMSKSRGNTVNPWEVMTKYGADATRLFLVSSSQMWVPKNFDENVIREGASRFLITLRNLYQGSFAQYANFGWSPSARDPKPADRPLLDRWVLSRLSAVEAEADAALERFDATSATRMIMAFIDDDVSKWYVRLAKRRFYETDSDDNRAAFATLHEVLAVACRLLAPFAPFHTDWIHRELTGTTVHLARYVRGREEQDTGSCAGVDAALEEAMAAIRALASAGRAARETAKVSVRQPLSRLVCVTSPLSGAAQSHLVMLVPILAAELNVKTVEFATSADSLVSLEAKPNFKSLGKTFGKETPLAAKAVAALDSPTLQAFERGEPVVIRVGDHEQRLAADDLMVVRKASGTFVVQQDGPLFAAIDPTVTPELRGEGIARELVSRTQRLRKESGLDVSDRIILMIAGPALVTNAVAAHKEWIAGEVLARDIVVSETMNDGGRKTVDSGTTTGTVVTVDIDGCHAQLALTKDV